MNQNIFKQWLLLIFAIILTACGGSSGGGSGGSSSTVTLQSINLTVNGGSVKPNNFSYDLVATGIYSDGTQKDLSQQVSLQSSNSEFVAIKQVTNQSVAYAVTSGTSAITATYNGVNSNQVQLQAIAATLQSITINTTNNVTPQGYSSQVTATGAFSDGNNYDISKDVNWNSTNNNIASFNTSEYADFGNLQFVQDGTSSINASYAYASTAKNKKATNTATIGSNSINVITTSAKLTTITVNATTTSIAKGLTTPLTATGTFSDGSSQNITKDVTWQSNSNVTINANGTANAVSVGSAVITATADGITSNSLNFVVTTAVLQSIVINTTNTHIAKGLTTQLTATGSFSDGTNQNLTNSVVWSSSNTDVSISKTGLVTGNTAGAASVSANLSGITSNSINLEITAATLQSIVINTTNTQIARGLTTQLTATGIYSDGSNQNITNSVIWNSTNADVTISNAGIVTGSVIGTSSISASLFGKTSNAINLTVTAATLQSITINAGSTSIAKGFTTQLTATGSYSDGTSQNITSSVVWSSSNADVTISNTGLVTGNAVGTTSITANLSGKTSNTVAITVKVWSLVGGGSLNPPVNAIAFNNSGVLYAAGTDVLTYDNNLDRWNTVGQTATYTYVYSSMSIDSNNNIYVATNSEGAYVNLVTQWNGHSWNQIGNGIPSSLGIYSIALDGRGNIYAGGDNVSTTGMVWKWDGTNWVVVGGVQAIAGITSVAVDNNGNVYAGGGGGVAQWNGFTWNMVGGGISPPAPHNYITVNSIAIDNNGNIYAGGTIYNDGILGGAVWKWNGRGWEMLGNGVIPNTNMGVNSIAFDIYGNVYAGGWYYNKEQSALWKWNGTNWGIVGGSSIPNSGGVSSGGLVSSGINSIVVDRSGDIYVGGTYASGSTAVGAVWKY